MYKRQALSLCGVLDECMWVIGNPLASTLAVISGLLAFSFTGMCVVVGALMFLTELTTEPPSQTQLARAEGISRKEYREREAARAEALKVETAAEETRRRLEREGVTDEATINAAIEPVSYTHLTATDEKLGFLATIWGLATLIPTLALSVRRLHDTNKPGSVSYTHLSSDLYGLFMMSR